MFGSKGAAELVKALARAIVLLGTAGFLLWQDLPLLLGLSAMPPDAAMDTVRDRALRLLLWLTLGLAVIAGVDLPWQLLQWLKRLRMSRQELKEEVKQQEGDPHLRAAIRRMGREAIRRSTAAAMAEASVVLTNPTHFAVALRYDAARDDAPLILARGRGPLAEAIMAVARERDIPMLRYPSVARALYFTGRVGQRIRPDLYTAVATILAFVRRVEAEVAAGVARSAPPPVDAPPTARFDPEGRPAAR
jgi:flagellar biosynthetic protein FlhB